VTVNQKISASGVLVHISVLEESIHDAQRVVTAQLHQESLVSCTSASPCWLIISSIVPNVCIEVSQNDRGIVSFNPSQGITNVFHDFRAQCTWGWAVYLHQTQGTAQKLQPAYSSS